MDIAIFDRFEPVRDAWRMLDADGIGSLYQTYDWLKNWRDQVAGPARMDPRIVLVTQNGHPLCLLPFGVHRRGPFTIATWLGDNHSNYHMGIYSTAFLSGIRPDGMRALIDFITPHLGKVDMIELCCQPVYWQGYANPFTFLKWQKSHNHAFALNLEPDFDAALNRNNGARKRKKMRWQTNKLKPYGGARLVEAKTPEDVQRILATSFRQLARRFDQAGIWNRFEDAGIADFFEQLAISQLGKEEPVLKLYGLEIAGELRATFAGGIRNKHFSGCFISLTDDEFARFSPGELIIYLVVQDCANNGIKMFDLGCGEERYKVSWCDTTIPMFETTIALSKRAIGFAAYERSKTMTKRLVRNNATMWSFAKKARARLYGRV